MEDRDTRIRAYCDAIKRHYNNLPEKTQREIVNDLEVLLLQHYAPGVIEEAEESIVPRKTCFNGEIARKIRIDAGLTQKQLCKLLRGTLELQGKLSRYESNRLDIRGKEGAGFKREYLDWLKSKGYDPFNSGESA